LYTHGVIISYCIPPIVFCLTISLVAQSQTPPLQQVGHVLLINNICILHINVMCIVCINFVSSIFHVCDNHIHKTTYLTSIYLTVYV